MKIAPRGPPPVLHDLQPNGTGPATRKNRRPRTLDHLGRRLRHHARKAGHSATRFMARLTPRKKKRLRLRLLRRKPTGRQRIAQRLKQNPEVRRVANRGVLVAAKWLNRALDKAEKKMQRDETKPERREGSSRKAEKEVEQR